MITCPNCGTENVDDSRFCSNCGQALDGSGMSEQVRCGMCGKPNPSGEAVCQHCGARLRPVTAPEETAPEAPPPAPTPEPPAVPPGHEELSLDDLRGQIATGPQEETIISRAPTRPLEEGAPAVEEEEPADFMIGGETDDLFDRLGGFTGGKPAPAGPPAADEKPEALGDLLDWMAGEAPSTVPSEESIPDWLREETPPAAPTEETVPDWLQEEMGPAKPAEPEPEPESQPPSPPPAESPGAVPDWLGAAQGDAPRAAAPGDLPDWLEAARPAQLTGAESTAVPDWLEVAMQASSSPAPEPEPPPAEEKPIIKAEPELPAADVGLPDWLAGAGEEEAAAPAEEAFPEWLSGVGEAAPPQLKVEEPPEPVEEKPAVEAEPEPPPVEAGLPAWLAGTGEEEAAAPAEEAFPEWLSRVGEAAPPQPEEEEPPEPVEEKPAVKAEPELSPVEAGLPDWLAGAGEEEAAAPAEEAFPDWLSGVGDATPPQPKEEEPPEPVEEKPAAEVEPELPAPETSPVEGEVPEWLMADETGPGAAEGDLPEWMAGLSAEEEEPPARAEAGAGDDWLESLGLTPPPSPPTPEPLELGWGIPEEEAPEPASPLPDLTTPVGEADLGDLPEWLSSMQPGEGLGVPMPPVPTLSAPSGGDDLFDLLAGISTQQEEDEEEAAAVEIRKGELPTWLQGLSPEREGRPGGEQAAALAFEPTPEMLKQMQALRFEAIEQAEVDQAETGGFGALKDMENVLQAEPVFVTREDPASTDLLEGLIVTSTQAKQVAALEKLLAGEKEGVQVAGKPRRRVQIDRVLVTLALLAAVVAPLLTSLSILPAPAARPGPTEVFEAIESLPDDGTVLLAFEYEPDVAGELDPGADAILAHLATRPGMTLYTISTKPTGPAVAQLALERAGASSRENWINLGYVSGRANGVRSLVIGSAAGIPSPLETDFLGEETPLGRSTLQSLAPDMVIILSAQADDVRVWVEQTGLMADISRMAVVGASAAPMVYPYRQSGQLVAVLSGLNDAVSYHALLESDTPAVSLWQTQALGALVAAAVIILGGIIYGLIALRQRGERES